MPSSVNVIRRMDIRVTELSNDLVRFARVFEEAETFSGPSLYFHLRTLDCLRHHKSSADALLSDELFEMIYATLASWGMHRMGRGNTKLRNLDEIKASVRKHASEIKALQNLYLTQINRTEIAQVTRDVWRLLSNLTISIAEAKIVANSKVLHHVLPNLIPPIDRTYTFNFFYNRNMLTIDEEEAFGEMFLRIHRIALENKDTLSHLVGTGWNTSETKVIDNAIVGYVTDILRITED